MSEDKKPKQVRKMPVSSWKLPQDILDMLRAISELEGESQAAVLRMLIRKEAKRRGIKVKE